MYTKFFGLEKAPFKITPDPAFFFAGGNRGAVLEALLYAVARGEGIVKVVGEVGSGKTMLCRMLERELPKDCEIIYLANPRLSPAEILHAIAIELHLGVDKACSKIEVTRQLHAFLLEKHANNRSVVMFIEEAQGMDLDTLEEIRMLSNLETTQDKLLQIVLFGQPELDDKLSLHEIRQLKERITYSFDLAPLNGAEIRDYVNTRIRASGFRGNELFTPAAIRSLKRQSGGLLRRINILADKALLAAFAAGERQIKPRHLKLAARDSDFDSPSKWRFGTVLAAITTSVLMLGASLWWFNNLDIAAVSNTVTTISPNSAELAVDAGELTESSPKLDEDTEEFLSRSKADPSALVIPPKTPIVPHLITLDALTPDTSPVLTRESVVELLAGEPPVLADR